MASIRVFGGLESGEKGYVLFSCCIEGCEEMPTRAWLMSDTTMGDDGLYVVCSKHDDVTFIYPKELN